MSVEHKETIPSNNATDSERPIEGNFQDMVRRIRYRRADFRKRHIVIDVPHLSATPYRDLLELLLPLLGAKSVHWRQDGELLPAQGILKNTGHIVGDMVRWFPLRRKILRKVDTLKNSPRSSCRYDKSKTPLYIRTDAVFDLRAGGAIAHSVGVINSLKELCGTVNLLLSSPLPGITTGTILTPDYGAGRNIPGLAGNGTNFQYIDHLDKNWQNLEPSFVYHRYNVGNYAAAIAAKKNNVPFVLEYNGSEIWIARNWGGRPLRDEKLFLRIENAVLQAADLVVVVSQPMKDELLARGIEDARILVNPNGVDVDIYTPQLPGQPVRENYGLREDLTVFGFIGSFGPWHGTDVLTEAFGLLLKENTDLRDSVHLLMIGDGLEMDYVKSLIARFDMHDKCTLTGTVPQFEAPSFLAACDVFVSPHVANADGTSFFGSPTKLFEYMSMGRAIAASNLDQIGDILTHEQTALMVPPGNAQALCEALVRLARSPELRHTLGTNARQQACQNHSWQQHTQNILARLEELCP